VGAVAGAHPDRPAIRATTHVEGKAIKSSRRHSAACRVPVKDMDTSTPLGRDLGLRKQAIAKAEA
jgi:hypothetical protein